MSRNTLSDVAAYIREQAAAYCAASKVPGYLAGVYHDGDQTVVAHGVANVATGAPMREDTGFLFGSVTKVLTTTLVLQQVERGVVDLEERVTRYLPEFTLATPAAAEQIRVRQLLSATNGIDADLFFLDAKGRGALKDLWEGETARVPSRQTVGDACMVLDYLLLMLATLRAALRPRSDLVLENLLLRHQLAVLMRPARPRRRVRFRRLDKLLWVLIRRVRRDWRRHLVLVTPDTVVRWHRAGWRLYWRWRSRAGGGRPRLSAEVRDLIARMSKENPLWGSERIRGELRKLGLVVSNRSIRRYRWRGPRRPPSQTWHTFLHNHAHAIWAADLFTIQTLTFKTLYVLLFITHGRRELAHLAVTAHPTAAWVWRQLIEATAWGRRPKHLVRDRDSVYGGDFRARAEALGIETILTPVRARRANAVAERVIGTLRRDCLDRVIPLDERHLRTILGEYVDYYNTARPHRTLQLDTPRPQARPSTGPSHPVRSRPVLGGLHHVYACAA